MRQAWTHDIRNVAVGGPASPGEGNYLQLRSATARRNDRRRMTLKELAPTSDTARDRCQRARRTGLSHIRRSCYDQVKRWLRNVLPQGEALAEWTVATLIVMTKSSTLAKRARTPIVDIPAYGKARFKS